MVILQIIEFQKGGAFWLKKHENVELMEGESEVSKIIVIIIFQVVLHGTTPFFC